MIDGRALDLAVRVKPIDRNACLISGRITAAGQYNTSGALIGKLDFNLPKALFPDRLHHIKQICL